MEAFVFCYVSLLCLVFLYLQPTLCLACHLGTDLCTFDLPPVSESKPKNLKATGLTGSLMPCSLRLAGP